MIGMLWFDNDKVKPLADKINEAAAYYRGKYGHEPNTCHINPRTLGETPPTLPGLTIEPSRYILPNHIWLGRAAE